MYNFQMCAYHLLCHPFSRMEYGDGGGELASSDHADENSTPRARCSKQVQGPATSSITWELIRNSKNDAAPQTYWIKILILQRGTSDLYALKL